MSFRDFNADTFDVSNLDIEMYVEEKDAPSYDRATGPVRSKQTELRREIKSLNTRVKELEDQLKELSEREQSYIENYDKLKRKYDQQASELRSYKRTGDPRVRELEERNGFLSMENRDIRNMNAIMEDKLNSLRYSDALNKILKRYIDHVVKYSDGGHSSFQEFYAYNRDRLLEEVSQ